LKIPINFKKEVHENGQNCSKRESVKTITVNTEKFGERTRRNFEREKR